MKYSGRTYSLNFYNLLIRKKSLTTLYDVVSNLIHVQKTLKVKYYEFESHFFDWSGATISDNDRGKWDIFLVTSGQYTSSYPSSERKVKTHECDRCCEHIKHAIFFIGKLYCYYCPKI